MSSITQVCSVDGCEKEAKTRGWCSTHYARILRRGTLEIHMEPHQMSKTPEYVSWYCMKTRCYNSNDELYQNYGKKGTVICRRWRESFLAFYSDLGDKPTRDYTIERLDVYGHYSCGKCEECIANGWPMNCRWATRLEQARNRRIRSDNKTGVTGVFFNKRAKRKKWLAIITINPLPNRKSIYLGGFETIEEAIKARKDAEEKYFGET